MSKHHTRLARLEQTSAARIEARLDIRKMSDADLEALRDAWRDLALTPDDVTHAQAYTFTKSERAALDAGDVTQLSDDALRAYIVQTFNGWSADENSMRLEVKAQGGNDETRETT